MSLKNQVVTHHNYINESRFENFTELELNLFIVILYKMRKESHSDVIFDSNEIKAMMNSKHRGNQTFVSIIEGLQDRTIYLKTEKGYDRIKPFPTLSFNLEEKTVKVEINKSIIPLLKELDQQFTQYSLKEFLSLNSKYGKRIYQMLKQYEKIGKRTIFLRDLRDYLDCTNKSYDKMSNLDKKVLFKAKEDINKNTSLKIDYKKNKIGRNVQSIEFSILGKERDTYSHIDIENADIIKVDEKNQEIEKAKIKKKTIKKDTNSHKLSEAILKAKRNIYVSKAWNKRVDNKIEKLVKDHGEEYAVDILNRLYEGAKQEIKTTVVQYINGIMKNVQAEAEDKKVKPKRTKLVKEKILVVEKANLIQGTDYISLDEFNSLDDKVKSVMEEKAVKATATEEDIAEKFLKGLKEKSFSIYFNTINKYMERP